MKKVIAVNVVKKRILLVWMWMICGRKGQRVWKSVGKWVPKNLFITHFPLSFHDTHTLLTPFPCCFTLYLPRALLLLQLCEARQGGGEVEVHACSYTLSYLKYHYLALK